MIQCDNTTQTTHTTHTTLSHGNISTLDTMVTQCIRVKKGIASQYLYRSMYAAQLYHCFKSIPRDMVLVINNQDLRGNPRSVMGKVRTGLTGVISQSC